MRDGECVYASMEQQHDFNFPYQLGTRSHDSPMDADCAQVVIKEGDIVIMGSDGVFDNLFDEEVIEIARLISERGILSIFDKSLGGVFKTVDPQRIANLILASAREAAGMV